MKNYRNELFSTDWYELYLLEEIEITINKYTGKWYNNEVYGESNWSIEYNLKSDEWSRCWGIIIKTKEEI